MALNLSPEDRELLKTMHDRMVALSEKSGPAELLVESISYDVGITMAVFRCNCDRAGKPNPACTGYVLGIADFFEGTRCQTPLTRETMQKMIEVFSKEVAQ